MKLELKHLAGYLPYGLKVYCIDDMQGEELLKGFNLFKNDYVEVFTDKEPMDLSYCKPILRPLSDLTKEKYFEMTGKSEKEDFALYFTNSGFYKQGYTSRTYETYESLPYYHILELLENHFDIYGLIENNLAIDKNTIS